MVINENNSHINSFTKGMNSDLAYDQIQNTQYTFGQNIRITKNQLLGERSENYSSLHEGVIAPVPYGTTIRVHSELIGQKILASDSVDRLIIVITTPNDKDVWVHRFQIKEDTNEVEKYRLLWVGENILTEDTKQLSIVLYKELENVIKLYIAGTNSSIITFRVDGYDDDKLYNNGDYINQDYLINNRIVPEDRVYIEDKITGRLKTSQVQYTYRFYNKYTNTTQLAPLTNKILVINNSRAKEIGNAEDTETAIGFRLSIPIKEYKDKFERIQVYRLQYIKAGENAQVDLIYDDDFAKDDDNFYLNDVGINPLQTLTIEEFAALSSIIISPKVIETSLDYMFAANVNDDTMIKGVKLVDPSEYGRRSNIELIGAKVILSENVLSNRIPNNYDKHRYSDGLYNTFDGNVDLTVTQYFKQRGINPSLVTCSYNNIFTSSLLRSLRRDEEYRYGIVYYDKYGRRSEVFKIGSVTPTYDRWPTFTKDAEAYRLYTTAVGVKINIPLLEPDGSGYEFDINDIVGCLIVRRSSSEIYQKTLLQVAMARPVSQPLLTQNRPDGVEEVTEDILKYSPFYPTGLLTVNNVVITPTYYEKLYPRGGVNYQPILDTTCRNKTLYQIFSSEIDFRRDDLMQRLSTSDMTIDERYYVFSDRNLYINGDMQDEGRDYIGTDDEDVNSNPDDEDVTVVSKMLYKSVYAYRFTEMVNQIDLENAYKVLFFVRCPDQPNDYTVLVLTTDNWMKKPSSIKEDAKFVFVQGENALAADGFKDLFDGNHGSVLYVTINPIPPGKSPWGPTPEDVTDVLEDNPLLYYDAEVEMRISYKSTTSSNINTSSVSFIDKSLYGQSIVLNREKVKALSKGEKQSYHFVFDFYNKAYGKISSFYNRNIADIKDVRIGDWDSGFSDITIGDVTGTQGVVDAIKRYLSFTTNIGKYTYNNWVAFGKYDFIPGSQSLPKYEDGGGDWYQNDQNLEFIHNSWKFSLWMTLDDQLEYLRKGFIGPGPSCFLMTIEDESDIVFPIGKQRNGIDYGKNFYTSICNIRHNVQLDDVESDEQTVYYGFGNYFPLSVNGNVITTRDGKDYVVVFDGDVYVTPHEFTTEYKTYNFNSIDTLQSTQITNYVPLESKVNTYFDYGMNLLNTLSANLIYEPGTIEGVTTQERPGHQYNMIYSDNDASNDVFTLVSVDPNETNEFRQRTYYSEPKTNGEVIDNFLIFKPASFIDVDSKYGQITELFNDKSLLYYWLDHAFGKFSVNERSLINDQNSNTIMLGQAGILSRYDYISTKYGMRLYDFCARSAERGIYWVDINNKAVVAASAEQAVNYGEQVGVQNIINNNISDDIPQVDYDLQNSELICKCFGDNNGLLIFNVKYNIGTSLYTRSYDDILYVKNHIYGLKLSNGAVTKYNYLEYGNETVQYLTPIKLSLIINPSASITKVFDNQQIVPLKLNKSINSSNFMKDMYIQFETDMIDEVVRETPNTDREGNILYAIPRYTDELGYGNRMRGKWMKLDIYKESPDEYFTISHIITKFRQSFS